MLYGEVRAHRFNGIQHGYIISIKNNRKITDMEWINIEEQLPPVNERVLVLWQNSHDEIVHSVTSRSRISRFCGKDAPIDDRYWIYASRHEINPLYWMPLPQIPLSK